MTVARNEHTDNVQLGAGEIYIDRYVGGAPTGRERYLGDSVGGTLSVTTERTTIQSGDGRVAVDLVDKVRSVSRTIGFTVRDMSLDNWALFLLGGEPADSAASGGTKTGNSVESFGAVKKGDTIALGVTANMPSGVGRVGPASDTAGDAADSNSKRKTVVYSDDSGTTAIAQANKWKLDEQAGRITFLDDIDAVYVGYTPTDAEGAAESDRTYRMVKVTKDSQEVLCAVRYIEDAEEGGRNVYVRKTNLTPGGELQLKSRDTEQQMPFTGNIVEPDAGWAFAYIDDAPLTAS